MKKSSFLAFVLGTVSGLLFALGMCMCLLPEWDSFVPGVVFGAIGIILGIITFFVWRKMEHKAPIRFNSRNLLFTAFLIIGALTLGVGMCCCMVWNKMILGVIIGIIGIVMLLSLIPITKGIK